MKKLIEMKNILILSALTVIVTSCSIYGIYKVGLQEVEVPKNVKEQFGESKVITFQDAGVTKYSYEDNYFKIIWLPGIYDFSFSLTNKSDHALKIIWDEIAYVNENGSSKKIFHSGVKYADRNNSQPPTIVVKGTSLQDLIIPTENAYYVDGLYVGWRKAPLFKNKAFSPKRLEALKTSYIGKVVKVFLPIKIEETTNEYLFIFKIEDFEKKYKEATY